MQRFFTYKTILPTLLIVFLIAAPHTANAAFSIGGLVIQIFGYLLWAAGMALDGAISLLVVQMGNQVMVGSNGNTGVGTAINTIWAIVRDLVNLTFIFGLIYVGIKTILDAGTDTKKMLASIIIGAVLVNFSLFISKVVIDVSNVTAAQIYGQMVEGTISGNGETRPVTISQAFMHHMGIINLIAIPNAQGDVSVSERFTNEGHLHYVFGTTIIMIFAAFVFFAGAILLAIRFAILIILMMLSPIAFAAAVFPSVAGWSKKWWDTLFSQAFFAPAYLFMLYIAMTVSKSYGNTSQQFDTLLTAENQNGVTALIFFAVTIAMLLASLIIAKQMGAYGSSLATRTAGKLSFGVVAAVGRGTIGQAGHRIGESDRLRKMEEDGGVVARTFARNVRAMGQFAGKSNYDMRTPIDKTGMAKLTNLEYGQTQSGGFTKSVTDAVKRKEAYAKSLREVDENDDEMVVRKAAVEALEDELGVLRDKRAAAQGDDKVEAGKAVRAKEKELQSAREALEREKNRRQIGSASVLESKKDYVAATTRQKQLKAARDALAKDLARERNKGAAANAGVLKILEKDFKDRSAAFKKQKEAVEKLERKYARELGYAGRNTAMGNSLPVRIFAPGTAFQYREAGDSIRKQYTKKAKQTKEDRQTDSIVDSVNKISTKAD